MNKNLIGIMVMAALTGCAHSQMRGNVAMKISEDEAHVCLGNEQVKVGDKIELYKNQCNRGKAAEENYCKMVTIGEGEIIKLLNEHYSVMKVNPGVKFEEGTLVQKK
jgi:hypothetical protein